MGGSSTVTEAVVQIKPRWSLRTYSPASVSVTGARLRIVDAASRETLADEPIDRSALGVGGVFTGTAYDEMGYVHYLVTPHTTYKLHFDDINVVVRLLRAVIAVMIFVGALVTLFYLISLAATQDTSTSFLAQVAELFFRALPVALPVFALILTGILYFSRTRHGAESFEVLDALDRTGVETVGHLFLVLLLMGLVATLGFFVILPFAVVALLLGQAVLSAQMSETALAWTFFFGPVLLYVVAVWLRLFHLRNWFADLNLGGHGSTGRHLRGQTEGGEFRWADMKQAFMSSFLFRRPVP